jgi:hypothetical protein
MINKKTITGKYKTFSRKCQIFCTNDQNSYVNERCGMMNGFYKRK